MASNKKYRMGYKLDQRVKKIGKSGGLENTVLKPNNNDPCPCGLKIEKLFTDEEGNEQIIPTPVKYKHCCRNKKIFILKDNNKPKQDETH